MKMEFIFDKENIYTLSFEILKPIKDMSYLFYQCSSYITINIYNFMCLRS